MEKCKACRTEPARKQAIADKWRMIADTAFMRHCGRYEDWRKIYRGLEDEIDSLSYYPCTCNFIYLPLRTGEKSRLAYRKPNPEHQESCVGCDYLVDDGDTCIHPDYDGVVVDYYRIDRCREGVITPLSSASEESS